MTATTAHAPRPTKTAIGASLDCQAPTAANGEAIASVSTEPDLEIDDIGPEPKPIKSLCTACGAEFKPPHSTPSAPLCFDCYEARKRALEVLPQTVKGKWLDILPALGVERERLQDEHGPCPGCGGTDRFRFDNRNGSGSWVCGGGGDTQSGDGFDLLSHVFGWDKRTAYLAVAEHMGINTQTKAPEPPTPEEIAERKRIADEQARKAADDLARGQAETATKAAALWEQAETPTENPYLIRKGVVSTENLRQIDATAAAAILGYHPQAGGATLRGPLLVVPITRDGQTTSLELIDGAGHKAALAGKGTKAGGYWTAGALPESDGNGLTLLIAEGVATALSAKEASGYPVIAALSVSNFPKVISAMRVRFPQARLALLADLDKGTGEPITAALKAARSFRPPIPLVAPDFGPDRPEGATDFNDLHQAQGLDVVRMQIETALHPTDDDFVSDESEIPDDIGPAPKATGKPSTPDGWKLSKGGVFEIRETENETKLLYTCGPLRVIGRTTGAHGEWGLVLAFKDHNGAEQQLSIPADRLHQDPATLVSDLSRQGLDILPSRGKRIPDYLAAWQPTERILSAKRLGWMEDPSGALSFVMPDRVITRDGNKQVVFQPDRYSPTIRTVHASGTLADWQTKVAAPVCRHRPMLFALCAGLAPALLAFAEAGDSFVLHFWGKTSRGKTTVGQISASPWGCAADPNDAPSLTFIRRWNVTGNGLEGLAESHSDMPLVLDELGSSTVGDIRPLIYQLAGGQGKTALNSAREMKEPRSWRTIAISTGELSLHARMSDPDGDGIKSRTVKGGLTHRALDVEIADIAEASPLSEREAVVSGVKVACARTYGTAGPEMVRLIAERFSSASAVRQYVKERIIEVSADLIDRPLPAETARAVRRFALIAVAGEFAAHAGLIPVEASEVHASVMEVVTAWLGASAETDEERIVASVRAFILKHERRFQRINEPEPETRTDRYGNEYQPTAKISEPVRDRVGFVDRKAEKWMFTDAGLVEAAPGNDKTTIARTLRRAGYLHTEDADRMTCKQRLPDESRPRLYMVRASILDGVNSLTSQDLAGATGATGASPLTATENAGPGRKTEPGPPGPDDRGQPYRQVPTPGIHSPGIHCAGPGGPGSEIGPGPAKSLAAAGVAPVAPLAPVKNEDPGKNPEIDDDREAF